MNIGEESQMVTKQANKTSKPAENENQANSVQHNQTVLNFSAPMMDKVIALGVLVESSPSEIIERCVRNQIDKLQKNVFEDLMTENTLSQIRLSGEESENFKRVMELFELTQEELVAIALREFLKNNMP